MGLVTGIVLPNEGDRIKAANYNDPITKILAQLNGNIDGANIAAGAIDSTKFAPNAVQTALGISSNPAGGWDLLNANVPPTVATGYNKGNREFDLTFAGVDLTGVLSPGMRVRLDRTGTTPTQCADLEMGSNQYATKASPSNITFVDDFTCEAWIKLESYGSIMTIIRRTDNSGNGFIFRLTANGQVNIIGANANNYEGYSSIRAVPLGEWVHVAATLDLSGNTANIYINGEAVPTWLSDGSTALNTIVQAGDLRIGANQSAAELFDGKLSDLRIWNVVRTATQIRDNAHHQLNGNESNLVGYWKLSGNFNDSTSNANNLTASGGLTATDNDHMFKSREYGIVQKVSFSTNTTVTIFTGKNHSIPLQTLSAPYSSSQKAPYGWPADTNWEVIALWHGDSARLINGASGGVWGAISNLYLTAPSGKWDSWMSLLLTASSAGTANFNSRVQLDTSSPTYGRKGLHYERGNAAVNFLVYNAQGRDSFELATPTNIQAYGRTDGYSGTTTIYTETNLTNYIILRNAYA